MAEGRRTVVGLYTPLRTVLRVDPAMRTHAEAAPGLFEQLLAVETLVYEQADGFLACGPAIVEEIEAAYGVTFPRRQLGTVAHGLADEAAGHAPAPAAGTLRLLFVGRLEARKGIDTLREKRRRTARSLARPSRLHVVGDSLVGPSGRTYCEDERAP